MPDTSYRTASDKLYLQAYDQDEDIYPPTSIRVTRPKHLAWKYALNKYLSSRRVIFIGLITCIAIILLIVIITLAVPGQQRETAYDRNYGLKVYPVPADGSSVIAYRAGDATNYKLLRNNVSSFLEVYQRHAQRSNDTYADCNGRHNSKTKPCRFVVEDRIKIFDDIVASDFCFKESFPCIWLQLKLPIGVTPQVVKIGSKFYPEVRRNVDERYSKDSIGVSCQGATSRDAELLKRGQDDNIEYYPKTGFPVYYYPATNNSHYLPPLVLVRFNHIHTDYHVAVRCTAWAVTSSGQLSQSSPLYTANFTLNIY